MKKKSVWIIVSMMVCLFCLSGCKPSALSEDEIADSFPENYRYLYIDGEAYLLDVKSIEIEKRKTDEDIDTVYCTIVMEDDNYRTTADYVLYYSYYDKGGWILDGCDTSDYYTEALCGLSQEKTDMEMSRYYFNSYNFVKEEFDKDTQTSYTYYDAIFTSDNYSYQGGVVLKSYFYGYSWETSLSYENDFDWNVSGIWAADPLDLSGTRFKKTAFEIEIYSVDQAAGTVELSATEYYDDSVDRVDDIVTDNVVVDYTGMDYLSTAGYRVSPDEEAKERMKYEAPSLSFKFSVGGSDCAVRIKPYEATVGIAGSGEVSGCLNKGYSIYSWIDEYDFTQFEKVVQRSQFTQNNNTSAVGFDNGFEDNAISENLTSRNPIALTSDNPIIGRWECKMEELEELDAILIMEFCDDGILKMQITYPSETDADSMVTETETMAFELMDDGKTIILKNDNYESIENYSIEGSMLILDGEDINIAGQSEITLRKIE